MARPRSVLGCSGMKEVSKARLHRHQIHCLGLGEVSSARLRFLVFVVIYMVCFGADAVGIKRRLAALEKGEEETASGTATSSTADPASQSSSTLKKGIKSRIQSSEEPSASSSDPQGPLFKRLRQKWAAGKMNSGEVHHMAMASEGQKADGDDIHGFHL